MPPIDPNAVEHIPAEAASTYAKVAAAYGREYYRSVAEEIVPRLAPGSRVLDAGTGPGFLPLLLAEETNSGRIDGFDFTRELLLYGRNQAKSRGVDDRISFFAADCYAIPVAEQRYSFLVSTGVLHSLDEPVRALAEFYRVLRPGGTAWVFDPAILDLPDDPAGDDSELDLTDHEQEVLRSYGVRKNDDEPPISVAEAERLVAESPFEDAEVREGEQGDVRLYLGRRE